MNKPLATDSVVKKHMIEITERASVSVFNLQSAQRAAVVQT
jgi:hypothetical protein